MAIQQDALDVFTNPNSGTAGRESTHEEPAATLVEGLRRHEPSEPIRRRLADRLRRAAHGERVLLGVLATERSAVYYSGRTRCVAAVPFSFGEPAVSDARPLGQTIDDPAAWLRHCGEEYDWAWLTPDRSGE